MNAKKLIKQYRRKAYKRRDIELVNMLINIKSRCPGYSGQLISHLKRRGFDRHGGQKELIMELFQDWCDTPNQYRAPRTGSKTYQENGKFYSMKLQDVGDLPF